MVPLPPNTASFKAVSANVLLPTFLQPSYTFAITDSASQPITLNAMSGAGTYKVSPVVTDKNYQVVGGADGMGVPGAAPRGL